MTDEILIAWLREYREVNEGSTGVSYDPIPECLAAADRIEALTRENANLRQIERNVQAVREHEFKRAEATEAKLAECLERNALLEARLRKAVEALDRLVALNDDYSPFGGELLRDRVDRTWQKARTTLAEIKGESHE